MELLMTTIHDRGADAIGITASLPPFSRSFRIKGMASSLRLTIWNAYLVVHVRPLILLASPLPQTDVAAVDYER